jgi:hypothetical protein
VNRRSRSPGFYQFRIILNLEDRAEVTDFTTAAEQTPDVGVRRLPTDLAETEQGHEHITA